MYFSSIKVKVCFSYTLSNGNKAFRKAISKCTPASGVLALCFIPVTMCLFLSASAVKYTVDADQNRRGARVQFLDKQSTFTGLLSFSAPACQELELTVIVRNHLITHNTQTHTHTTHTHTTHTQHTTTHMFPCFMGHFLFPYPKPTPDTKHSAFLDLQKTFCVMYKLVFFFIYNVFFLVLLSLCTILLSYYCYYYPITQWTQGRHTLYSHANIYLEMNKQTNKQTGVTAK